MTLFSIDKMRRLSRSQWNTGHEERAERHPVRCTPNEPPPSYDAATGNGNQLLGQPEIGSAAVLRTRSAPYRQTHQPPEYQSSADLSLRQTVSYTASTTLSNPSLPYSGDQSLTKALGRAALAGKADAVRALLEAGADIYDGTSSAVHDALRGAEPELALMLLDYPYERAYQGDLSSADKTVDGEARVTFLLSVEDNAGRTPLHLAASAGATDVVREMLRIGAVVNVTDQLGMTPLHMAARYGRADAMDLLLEHGADPDLVHDDLWDQASPRARIELGDRKFVRQSVIQALKRRGQFVKDDEDVRDGSSHSTEHVVRTDHVMKGARDMRDMNDDIWQRNEDVTLTGMNHQTRRRYPTSSAGIGSHGASIVSGSFQSSGAMFSRYRRGPAPSSAGFCTTWKRSAGHRTPRLPDATMHSPEYDSWRKMCQTLQEEHRRQKERNQQAGFGYGGLY